MVLVVLFLMGSQLELNLMDGRHTRGGRPGIRRLSERYQTCFTAGPAHMRRVMVGRRNLRQVAQLLLEPRVYIAIPQLFQVHEHPLHVILEEMFAWTPYPRTLGLRTPTGTIHAHLYSAADLSTANLVFCRQDYHFPRDSRVVVDIGSNIGLSSLYWLSRNPDTLVHCYEPAPRTYQRLLHNLAPYAGRFTPHEVAVSDFRGTAEFGLEPSGVNSSLVIREQTEVIQVRVVHVNDALETVLSRDSKIDVLKLDNEGHEFRTLQAIAPEFWQRIRCVNVGCHHNAAAVPKDYRKSIVGSAERFVLMTTTAQPPARG
jgi:FkbM family methyltransferase